jgi:hypothetical protein
VPRAAKVPQAGHSFDWCVNLQDPGGMCRPGRMCRPPGRPLAGPRADRWRAPGPHVSPGPYVPPPARPVCAAPRADRRRAPVRYSDFAAALATARCSIAPFGASIIVKAVRQSPPAPTWSWMLRKPSASSSRARASGPT